MELIKIVKVIGSFFLVALIISIPFVCALSYALNWHTLIKFALTAITTLLLDIGTGWIYAESEGV